MLESETRSPTDASSRVTVPFPHPMTSSNLFQVPSDLDEVRPLLCPQPSSRVHSGRSRSGQERDEEVERA